MAVKTRRNIREQIKELGFGTRSFEHSERLILQDGTFNIQRRGGGFGGFSLYHWVINTSWFYFFCFILFSYLVINLFFAAIYFWIGPETLTGYDFKNDSEAFLHCFYFSTQTLTTVGFGRISPIGIQSSMLAAFEAMLGLLSFALATGILYGRFSKAKAKILFSKKAIIGPYQEKKGLKIRIANQRKNQLIDMSARVIYSYLEMDKFKQKKRRYRQLDLEIDFINLFPLPWTLVHPINEESPLNGKGMMDLSKEKAEILVILKGYDDTFNQYVHQIFSYRYDEFLFDADFLPMFDTTLDKAPVVYLDRISDFKKMI